MKLTTILVMSVAVASCAHQIPETPLSTTNQANIADSQQAASESAVTNETSDVSLQGQSTRHSDLWQRIRESLALADVSNSQVDKQIQRLKKNKEIEAMVTRGEPLLHYLLELAERRGMPAELVLIPMIESSFKPDALSPGNAAGLWQIRPATARNFGLTVNKRYDQRYDIHASTLAAFDYLEYLYDFFDGDWLLAVAAYNCGEGTVQKAMRSKQRKDKKDDYWALDNLPRITRNYVPKMLALAQIIAKPEAHGVQLPHIDDKPYLFSLDIDSSVNPYELITTTGINSEIAFYFNPAFKKKRVPDASYRLLLPRQQAILLSNNLNRSSNPIRLAEWSRPGQENNTTRSSAALFQHHQVRYSKKSDSTKTTHSEGNQLTYTVSQGDTLENVARLYGVPVELLAQWNQLKTDSRLKKGQKLVIKIFSPTKQVINQTIPSFHRTNRDWSFITVSLG